MKYLVVTKNPRYKMIFSGILSQKRILFNVLENEGDVREFASSRGRKTVFLDHDTDIMDSEEIVALFKEDSSSNIVISFGNELDGSRVLSLFRTGLRDMFTEPLMPDEMIDLAIRIKKEDEKKVVIEEKPAAPKGKEIKCRKPLGVSNVFKSLLMLVERVADSDATIMISGESGTGKEVLSQYIHMLSKKSENPFVPVNCGAIPENLLESELFGHVKGAFTGAFSDRKGRFEVAGEGTIFLDEIGEMPLHLQVKLLRVLQEREVQPVGSNDIVQIHSRIITATNRDLEEEVRKGNFREDLFYRLNIIPIHIPPLRQRKDDIPVLCDHFISKFNERHNKNVEGLDKSAIERMMEYDWPGNIRELENSIERMVVIKSEGVVEEHDLPPKIRGIDANPLAMLLGLETPEETKSETKPSGDPFGINWAEVKIPEDFDLKQFLEGIETDFIKNAMNATECNKNQAAGQLGLNRTTLIEKIKKKQLSFD